MTTAESVHERTAKQSPRHVMLAASFGGHWKQLMVIDRLLDGESRRLSYVSTSPERPPEAAGADYYRVTDCNAGERLNALRCLGGSLRLMWRLRPDLLITTGALPGLLLALAAKLTGTRVIWIDSVANAEELSSSGRMAARFVDLCCTQWPHLASDDSNKGPVYLGSVL